MKAKKQVKYTPRTAVQQDNAINALQGALCQLTQRLDQHAQLFDEQNDAIVDLQDAICPKVAARLTALERTTKALEAVAKIPFQPDPKAYGFAVQLEELTRKVQMIAQDERNNCIAIDRLQKDGAQILSGGESAAALGRLVGTVRRYIQGNASIRALKDALDETNK